MPTLESLQSKRKSLASQQEQHVALVNRIGGAIALLDDLIKEQEAEEASTWKAAAGVPYERRFTREAFDALDVSHDAPPIAPDPDYIPTGNMTPPAPFVAGESDAA